MIFRGAPAAEPRQEGYGRLRRSTLSPGRPLQGYAAASADLVLATARQVTVPAGACRASGATARLQMNPGLQWEKAPSIRQSGASACRTPVSQQRKGGGPGRNDGLETSGDNFQPFGMIRADRRLSSGAH